MLLILLLFLEPDKTEWKPTNLSDLALGDIFRGYDDGMNNY